MDRHLGGLGPSTDTWLSWRKGRRGNERLSLPLTGVSAFDSRLIISLEVVEVGNEDAGSRDLYIIFVYIISMRNMFVVVIHS